MIGGSAAHAPREEVVTVAARFNGPPESANGGYVCGLVGSRIEGAAEVTLLVPPPLEVPLTMTRHGDGVLLRHGDTVVAEGVSTTVDVEPPARVSVEDAERAAAGYLGFAAHAFPTCFVCGPQRRPGDGLQIYAGPVEGTSVCASPWTPPSDLADPEGVVRPEVVAAAVDCPSYFGGPAGVPAVLGRLAVDIRAPVLAGRPHVVLGWGLGSERRKHFAAAAVTSVEGEVLAVSRATWVQPRADDPGGAG